MSSVNFKGGDKLNSILQEYVKKLNGQPTLSVGFFSGSTEAKTGIPSAQAALLNEYGSTGTVVKKDGTTVTRVTPPRPFFRMMIADGNKHWGQDLGKYLLQRKMSASEAMNDMGEQMREELKESIQLPRYAPLAQSTIDKKGHSQTLIDTSDMLNAVNFQLDM